MYTNVLERSGKIQRVVTDSTKVQQIEELKETPKITTKVVMQDKPKAEKKKEKVQPKIKQAVEVDDDMAFLDQVIGLNNVCAMSDCSTQVSGHNYNACRGCQKVFCPHHVAQFKHNCDDSNPISHGAPKEQSQAQRSKADKIVQQLKQNRTAKQP